MRKLDPTDEAETEALLAEAYDLPRTSVPATPWRCKHRPHPPARVITRAAPKGALPEAAEIARLKLSGRLDAAKQAKLDAIEKRAGAAGSFEAATEPDPLENLINELAMG